jgi:hypothetical protein
VTNALANNIVELITDIIFIVWALEAGADLLKYFYNILGTIFL